LRVEMMADLRVEMTVEMMVDLRVETRVVLSNSEYQNEINHYDCDNIYYRDN
jgi:hypothetical protein